MSNKFRTPLKNNESKKNILPVFIYYKRKNINCFLEQKEKIIIYFIIGSAWMK